jgi:two-component system nitrogen regulation response regulator GlnG
MTKILIIDDVRCKPLMEQHLGPRGFVFDQVLRATDAERRIETFKPDLVLLDLHFPDDAVNANSTTGGRLYKDLVKRFPGLAVAIFSTRPADTTIPKEAFDSNPLASLVKPDFNQPGWDKDFAARLTRVLDTHRRTAEKLGRDLGFVVGQTPAMLEFARRLETAARTGDNLLLRGETGTGKTLAAEAAHRLSGRSGSFVTVRPASLPPQRVAADLTKSFAKCVGGTLCLMAEDLPDYAETALLGLLDTPPGDVRIITSIGSGPAVGAGLRSNLLTRLRGFELALPPLRERLEDIPELFARSVESFNAQAEIQVRPILRPETLSKLRTYDWPGNIRELEAVLRQALTFTRNDVLMPDDIDFDLPFERPTGPSAAPEEQNLADAGFARLEALQEGDARWKEFTKMPKFLAQPTVFRIVETLRNRHGIAHIKQDGVAEYFYGNNATETHRGRVRHYLSSKELWKTQDNK